jgi:GntR family transcriptional regulator
MTEQDAAIAGLTPDRIDAAGSSPLYHQIYTILRELIRKGDFPADSVLPGEQDLTKRLGVSRITVKRALNELAAHGLVRRQRGRGTVVTYNATFPVVKGSFDNLIGSLKVIGFETEVELLAVDLIPAVDEVSDALELDAEAIVQRAVRLRKLDGDPFSFLITFVPEHIARGYTREELASTPLLALLERAGAKAYEAEQYITACSAEPAIATALRIATGAPLLKIERVMRDRAGTPVQLIHAYYRPERFQYHMRMTRRRNDGRDVWGAADE